jgi:ribosomal protein S18 acetylase RimI-like enzyme
MVNIIQPATAEDIPTIHQLFIRCTDVLLAAGIGQWHYDYPALPHIQADVLAGEAFVIKENNQCIATITLNAQQDEQYQAVNWKFPSDKILVIHRLGVHPNAQGRGLAKALCLFAEAFAQSQQYTCIRLDAYAGNPASNALYQKLGYHLADGLCHFHGNELAFYCWEKRVGGSC